MLRQCGTPDDAAVRRLWSQMVAVAKEELVFLVDSVRADKPFQVTAKYRLEKFLISK